MEFQNFLFRHEKEVRMSIFFGILAIMALWEIVSPRRKLQVVKWKRWVNNLGIVFMNSFLLRLLFPMAAAGVAAVASEKGWGILNNMEMPALVKIIVSVVLLDMVIYFQHVMVHSVPLFWRLHQVHHADMDYDVTTGARFHFIEIALSMAIKFASVVLIGAPVAGVIIFEIVLNGTAMFNHGNVYIHPAIDRVLRLFVVTPDMHRVHHSTDAAEANCNFGFNLPWWDRIFGTYKNQPDRGHEGMEIGIHEPRDEKSTVWITGMLAMPFRGKITDYVINRRWK